MHPVKYGAHHHHYLQQHHQQLMNDDGSSSSSSSVFSISNPHHYQSLLHHHHHNPNYPHQNSHHQQQKQDCHQSLVTHQLFQHHHHHQFQPFQQQAAEAVHHHVHQQPFLAVDFKLGLNENRGEKEAALALNPQENDATGFLHGNEHHVPENRRPQQHSLLMQHSWHPQEDSPSIKEPFWKALNRCEERQCNGDGGREIEGNKYNKVLQQPGQCTTERSKSLDTKYRHFGELEAIYGLAKAGETAQAGSGSALTGENSPETVARLSMPINEIQGHHVVANGGGSGNVATGVDHGSESTSIGEEASMRKTEKNKRKRKMKEQLSSMVGFFESLVKQVTDHQEGLHKKFLGVIERLDKERTAKEDSWRREEAEKRNREAFARAHEQALATRREAIIVSSLEKITGQRLNLPGRTPLLVQPESTAIDEPLYESMPPLKVDSNSRWPRAEVEALIQVRCNLESKFREPGLKGPLWEEVSSFMASLGYQRSAKRCKEKWENINKYFRKIKENGKKRSQQSKTCTYFDQLDQLYSRIPIICPTSPSPLVNNDIEIMQQQGDSDLLEAYMRENHLGTAQVHASGSLKVSEMNSTNLDFDGAVGKNVVQGIISNEMDNESHENYLQNEGEPEDDDNDRDMGNEN